MKAGNYFIMTSGLAMRAALLAGLAVVLARVLGSDDYGIFAATTSLAGFVATFCGLGAGPLHVRDVSQGRLAYSASLLRLASMISISSFPLLVIALVAAYFLIPAPGPRWDVVMLTIGEFCTVTFSDAGLRVMQSRDRYWGAVAATCGLPALRFVIVAGLALAGSLTLHRWSVISLTVGTAALSLFLGFSLSKTRGKASRPATKRKDTLGGIGFALSWASSRVHGDADKVLVARLASPAIAGQYSIAYRLADALTLPITAGVEALLPRLFQQGTGGARTAMRKARFVALGGLFMAVALSAVVYAAAPLLAWLLGTDYRASVAMARMLALLPTSMAIWTMARTLAATSGHHQMSGVVELAGAAFNVTVTTALVWAAGWKGAVLATYATHAFMVMVLIGWLTLSVHRARKSNTSPSLNTP